MAMVPCFNCNPTGRVAGDAACGLCSGRGQIQTDSATAAMMHAAGVTLQRRIPVAFTPGQESGTLWVLANDGTLWMHTQRGTWREIPALPQPAPEA